MHERLEDERADLAGVAFEQCAEPLGRAQRAGLGRLARLGGIGVGRGREQRLGQQGRIDPAVQGDVAHRERAQGFAVVSVGERHELRPARLAAVAEPVERHLQRDLDARRAVVGVEHLGQRRAAGLPRRDLQQLLGELDRGRVREPGQDHLFEDPRLARDGRRDPRLRMAVQVGPPAGHAVEVAPAVPADQPRTVAAFDRQERQHVRVLAHLRAGMPEHRQVALAPAGRGRLRYHFRIVDDSFHPGIIARHPGGTA